MNTRLFNIFKIAFFAHIQTKTTCPLFHEKSQDFYELLLEVFHTIAEKSQDLGIDEVGDENEHIKDTYDALEEAKSILTSMTKQENSIGMDNLLRGLIDKLEFACGNAKGFVKEEEEETGEVKVEEPVQPKKLLR